MKMTRSIFAAKIKKRVQLISLLITIGFCPFVSMAQVPADGFVNPLLADFVEPPLVEVASQYPQTSLDAPATVYVIDQKQIRLRGYIHLSDALRDVPGMETIEFFYSEIGTQVPVRGMAGNERILFLLNGMPLNPPGREPMMLRSDMSVRYLDRIEVMYGPGSTRYGHDAVNAVINLVTKKPDDLTISEVGLNYGHQETREVWASLGQSWRGVELTGHFQYHESTPVDLSLENLPWWRDYEDNFAGIIDPDTQIIEPVRWDDGLNGFARLQYKNSALQLWHRESSRSSSEGLNFFHVFVEAAKWKDRATVLNFNQYLPMTKRFRGDFRLGYSHYEILPGTQYVRPISSLDYVKQDNKYGKGAAFSADARFTLDLAADLELAFGGNASRHDVIPETTIPDSIVGISEKVVELSGVWQYYTDFRDSTTLVEFPRTSELEYETFGGFLEATWQFAEPLKVVVGGRLSKDTRIDDIPLGGHLALIFRLSDALTLRYTFDRGYVTPNPERNNSTYDDARIIKIRNEMLEHETLTANELNLHYQTRNLSVDLSGFYNLGDRLLTDADRLYPENIVIDTVYADRDTSQARILTQTVNSGDSRAYGLDMWTRFHLPRANFWASYSYVDYKRQTDSYEIGLEKMSHHNVRLGVTYAMARNLFFTPSFWYRSKPADILPDKLTIEVESPYALNMHVLFRPTDKLDLFVDLRNFTNHNYALSTYVSNNYARAFDTGTAIPQETYRGTLGFRYYW